MSLQEIIQTIKAYDTIIIHRHVRPDPDAYGSQGALKEMIRESFPEKQVYAVGEEDPALHFLAKMDYISDDVYKRALVIVCDTANAARISDVRYKLGVKLLKIDHHPNVDSYGDLQWIDTTASSTSEIIYDLYVHAKEEGFHMNDEVARLIYAGIVGDTGRFLFSNTTKKTFQQATELVSYEFDRENLYNHLYSEKDHISRLKGYILQHFSLSASGVSNIKLTKELLDAYHIKPMETGTLVGTLGDIEGILAWVIFIEEERQIRVRIRSKGPVIKEIAARFNGGGHPMAAGASVYSWEETDQVIQDLEEVCRIYRN